ncbi:MAG: adenosine deaminase, partial [Propionibacteriaceae bacterium]
MTTKQRDLRLLPKAHLHLHFTGSLDVPTLIELADKQHLVLPDALIDAEAFHAEARTKRGWFRFQRSYDVARRAVVGEAALRTVVQVAARNDLTDGSRRMEIQVDPTSYAPSVGGLIQALEIICDEARTQAHTTGLSIGIIVAASRLKNPFDARTLARLAAKYAGAGPGEVIGFGLNNDEQEGHTPDWEVAFRIADKAGLAGVPHAGELRGPEHITQVLDTLHPTRLGHGVRAVEDPRVLERIVAREIAFELCPMSNLHLGLFSAPEQIPLRALVDAGAIVALGADDPLLFQARLTDQSELARTLGFSDIELAGLARSSIRASLAPEIDKQRWLT